MNHNGRAGVVQTPPVPQDLPCFTTVEEIDQWRKQQKNSGAAAASSGFALQDPFADSLNRKLKMAHRIASGDAGSKMEAEDENLFKRVSVFSPSKEELHTLRKSFISEVMLLIKTSFPHTPPFLAIGAITFVVESYLAECTVLPSIPLRDGERQVVMHYLCSFFSRHGFSAQQDSGVVMGHRVEMHDRLLQRQLRQDQLVSMASPGGDQDIADAFDQVTATNRERLIRLLARYDPGRLFAVDAMLEEAAAQGSVTAEEELLTKLIKEYGPEPPIPRAAAATTNGGGSENSGKKFGSLFDAFRPLHGADVQQQDEAIGEMLRKRDFPTVALCEPLKSAEMVAFTGTVRSCRVSSSYRWHLLVGNEAIALDVFVKIGVAKTTVLSHVRDAGDPYKAVATVRLELLPGSIEPLHSYAVWLTVTDQHGSARESRRFVAPVFGRELN